MTTYREKIGLFLGLILLSPALFLLLDLPVRTYTWTVLGSPLTLRLSEKEVMAALMMALACVGTESVVRSHPRGEELRFTFTSWILPALLGLAGALFFAQDPAWPYWLSGLFLLGLSLSLTLAAEYQAVDPQAPFFPWACLALRILGYLLIASLFVIIYGLRVRALLSATSQGALSALLVLAGWSWSEREGSFGRRFLYACLIGLVMSELAWALNYWRAGALKGGLALFLFLYALSGMAEEHLHGRFRLRTALEFSLVALAGLAIVALRAG